jgi:hypothetical protein
MAMPVTDKVLIIYDAKPKSPLNGRQLLVVSSVQRLFSCIIGKDLRNNPPPIRNRKKIDTTVAVNM